jgi:hypothetical protein
MTTDDTFLAVRSIYDRPLYGRVLYTYTYIDGIVELEVVDDWQGEYQWILFGPIELKKLIEVTWEEIPEKYQQQILEASLRD